MRRWITTLTVALFLAGTAAYAAHEHLDAGLGSQTQCNFCVHFSAVGAAPAAPTLVCSAEQTDRVPVLLTAPSAAPERKARAHGSRAPPVPSAS